MVLTLAVVSLLLSVFPALMFMANLPLFRIPSEISGEDAQETPQISVLIPARDEEAGIEACVRTALLSEDVEVEVVVLDDASEDRTAQIVEGIAAKDGRVRLISGKPLADGWNGKQHACKQLADAASFDNMVFLDADVRLQSGALARLAAYRSANEVALLSAFPRQVTETWLEKWLIPMMHFILLCYLPFSRMRSDGSPSLAAGCGQLFFTKRRDYAAAGTHEAIRQSRHDGVKLPRIYRQKGLSTDVIDGTHLASCRMYQSTPEVIRGALKNAIEGIANPRVIAVFTVFLFGCSTLPVIATWCSYQQSNPVALGLSLTALAVCHLPRFTAAIVFRQSWLGAVSHIPATMTFLVLQWLALFNHLTGRQIAWRGRTDT